MKTGIRRLFALALLATAAPSVAWAAELSYQVAGLEGALATNVEAYLAEPDEVRSEREARGLIDNAREKATEALQALGHYNPTIDTALSGDSKEGWTLTLTIQPGPPVRLRNVRIEVRGDAADDPVFDSAREQLPLKSGDVLNHGDYESAKNALRSDALTRGYFDYAFSASRIEVDTDANTADIHLVLESGPRYSVSGLTHSDTPFRDDLIDRLIDYEPPQPYDADDIAKVNRRLLDSGYFSGVRVNVLREEAVDGDVPVRVDLSAREPNTIGFGVGYSTDEGPRVRFNWDRHWVNDRGHQLFNEVRVSAIRQNITSRYVIPLEDPLNDRLQFQAGLQAEDTEDGKSRRATVGVQREQTFESGWKRVQSLRYLQERFEQADDNFNTGLLLPGLSFSRTRARGQPDPYWGDSQNYSVEVGSQYALSDIDIARLTIKNRWLRNINRDHRFLLGFDAGAIATNSFEEVPSSLRFFAGGDNSIRGYDYRTLAPENDDGEVIGGRYLLTGTAEYSYPVVPNWRLALFTDAGNAFDDFGSVDYKVGSGFGVRWISPVGPIRLDLAWGVSEDKVPFRIHFALGPPF